MLAAGLSVPAAEAAKTKHPVAKAATHRPALRGTKAKRRVVKMPSSPTDPAKDAELVIDGATGKVLYARNQTAERHPASLTKMMTLYLLFDALKAGKMTMETAMPVSAHAAAQKPTKLYLHKGDSISVDTAIRAIVIRSANDVAVTIAEALGGTEGHFAEMMTEKARALGMKETNFHNASGLPDPLQITTAADLAVLARHLAYDFPQYFWYFGLSGFNYKGTWYPTHDNLIGRYDGADGIKTGYINASGFNLVSSVVRGGHHIIGVVLGGRTALRRDLEMIRILDDTFNKIAENPTLVASRTVPWHQYGGAAAPVVASLSVAPSTTPAAAPPQAFTPARSRNPFSGLTAMVSPAYAATHAEEDEDAAEKKVAPDEDASIMAPVPRPAARAAVVASAAAPAPNAVKPLAAKAPPPGPPPPAVRPAPRPAHLAPVLVAARAVPQPRPALRMEPQGEGDSDAAGSPAVPPPTPGHNWTIQIGAYADKALAQAQLSAYADKARDVLGQASKIVTPAQSADGHTIWRARFGLFAENEARDVCSRLTSRGQTCFAAIAAAR